MHCVAAATELAHTATNYNTLQHTATHHTRHVAALKAFYHVHKISRIMSPLQQRCNTMQHTATHTYGRSRASSRRSDMQHTATRCNTLQHIRHTATYCQSSKPCTVLQYPSRKVVALICYTLQHNATHCNTHIH